MKTNRCHKICSLVILLISGFSMLWAAQLLATDCFPEDINLSTQQEVDAFQADHGPCDNVVGQLTISGEEITNVDGLSSLTSIGSHFFINSCGALLDVDGLSNLKSVGGAMHFVDNDALVDVNGLSNIGSVGSTLLFAGNDALVHLDGLGGVTSAEQIEINTNSALESINGLSGLSSIEGRVSIDANPSLTNLAGLSGLVSTGGDLIVSNNLALSALGISNLAVVGNNLTVEYNYALANLDLTSLTEVAANVYMYGNHSLTNLEGLSSLESVGIDLVIDGHSNLNRCGGLKTLLDDVDDGVKGPGPGIDGVPDVGRHVSLGANLSGCNSIQEVMTILSDGFESPFNTITEIEKSLADTGGKNSIALGGDGFPVIGYTQYDLFTPINILKVAKCTDIRCASSVINVLDGSEVFSIGSMATGQDGLPIISYWQNNGLLVAKCNDYFCSGANESISIVDDLGGDSSLAIGADGLPVISYQTEGKLMVAKCNDPACSGGDEIITAINDFESNTGRAPSIAIGSDGFPVISYQRISGPFDPSTIKVAKCNDIACSGGDEIISVIDNDGLSFLALSNSIDIEPDGLPVIAYAGTNGSINVVKCNDAACSGEDESKAVIESTGFVTSVSLTIGQDGFPVISYEDFGIGALKVAKCEDVGCLDEKTIAIIEDEHNYGPSSVTIGVDGLPIISYRDRYALSLKVAHCESESCQ
jgi:hypothetical protein